jgi:hypothetical protein
VIPKGAIWQELRRLCLDSIPAGSVVNFNRPGSLADWVRSGYYSVPHTTSRGFDLITPATDIGGALLGEIEHFLDQAAEHQASLWAQVNIEPWLSPAWLVVTFYYWSFYLALALTRLLGRTSWFIDGETSRTLALSGGTGTHPAGSGCYRLTLGSQVSIVEREVKLKKIGGRIHEDVWRNWDELCRTQLLPHASGSSNSLEDRLYASLTRVANELGPEWPSTFRNFVNYRPGFAYTAVKRIKVLDAFSYLRTPVSYQFDALIGRFESRVVAVHGRLALENSPRDVALLLADFTFLLYAIVAELYADLLDRYGIDTRWRNSRLQFLKDTTLMVGKTCWPM